MYLIDATVESSVTSIHIFPEKKIQKMAKEQEGTSPDNRADSLAFLSTFFWPALFFGDNCNSS